MADYPISKKAVQKKLIDLRNSLGNERYISIGITMALHQLDGFPQMDAVPVVRCWECEKFWEYTESHKATVEKADGDCMIRCMVAPDDPQFCAVQKDDYCSMGKRKGAKMDANYMDAPTKDEEE